ncbi:MAG: hypothetical protein ACK5L0_07230 [Candidatus Fimivivens sp.]
MPDTTCDGLFEALDTLRHEAFALQNALFSAPCQRCNHFALLLLINKAKQDAIRDNLSQFGYVF